MVCACAVAHAYAWGVCARARGRCARAWVHLRVPGGAHHDGVVMGGGGGHERSAEVERVEEDERHVGPPPHARPVKPIVVNRVQRRHRNHHATWFGGVPCGRWVRRRRRRRRRGYARVQRGGGGGLGGEERPKAVSVRRTIDERCRVDLPNEDGI